MSAPLLQLSRPLLDLHGLSRKPLRRPPRQNLPPVDVEERRDVSTWLTNPSLNLMTLGV
jgi:hypothetical protein